MTALAATTAKAMRDVSDCTSISIFAHDVRGNVSVGLKAVELVKDK